MSDRAARAVEPPAPSRQTAASQPSARGCACAAGPFATGLIQRCPSNGKPDRDCAAQQVPGGPGAPMESGLRTTMERRFGADSSQVRVHTDRESASSARSLGARAWTRAPHIHFGDGQYAPHTPAGPRLLAHELAHVVQQHDGASPLSGVEPEGSPAEREAETAAEAVTRGEQVTVGGRTRRIGLDRVGSSCVQMIAAPHARVRGRDAHDAIVKDFEKNSEFNTWRNPGRREMKRIPDASFRHYTTKGYSDTEAPSTIDPVALGGLAGYGTPDVAHQDGQSVEIAEIKPATWGALVLGEVQALNYVFQGNRDENKAWRRAQGLAPGKGAFRLMRPVRFTLSPLLRLSGSEQIEVASCLPGLIGYRPLTKDETEVFACGALSDKGAVDRFLDRALESAQRRLDTYIDRTVGAALGEKIRTMSLRDALRLIAKQGGPELVAFARAVMAPAGAQLAVNTPVDAVVEALARYLEAAAGLKGQDPVRRLLVEVKDKFLDDVRAMLRKRLRTMIQQQLNRLCVLAGAAASISVYEVLKDIETDFGDAFGQAAAEVAKNWATALLVLVAKAVGEALLYTLAVVVILFLLLEILAALGSVGAQLAAVGTAVAGAVARLWPLLMTLVPAVRAMLQSLPDVLDRAQKLLPTIQTLSPAATGAL